MTASKRLSIASGVCVLTAFAFAGCGGEDPTPGSSDPTSTPSSTTPADAELDAEMSKIYPPACMPKTRDCSVRTCEKERREALRSWPFSRDHQKLVRAYIDCLKNHCSHECPGNTCGNGVLDANEVCDGTNFGGLDCSRVTMGAKPDGVLRCTTQCQVDVTGCTGTGPGTGGAPGTGGSPGTGGATGTGGGN